MIGRVEHSIKNISKQMNTINNIVCIIFNSLSCLLKHCTSYELLWFFFRKRGRNWKKAIATVGSFSGMFGKFVANIVRAYSRTNAPRVCYLWIYFNFSLATTSAAFKQIQIACESKERKHKQQQK